ncbi:MAG: hypothetical protein RL612_850 [Actinomycetota bacterium]|jgi:hypothetical protein
MTMVDHVLREDSLHASDNAMLLEVGLPWFRSVPLSCVNGLIVTIGDQQFETKELQIEVNGKFIELQELPDSDLGEWFLQDRKRIKIPTSLSRGELQKVRVQFEMVIPNIFQTPEKPAHLPMVAQAELQVL